MDEFEASTAAAVADLQRKQAKRARWSAIGGLVLMVVLVARCAAALFAGTPSCFDQRLTATDLINKAIKQGGRVGHVTDLAAPDTTASAHDINHCTARVTLSDGSRGVATYRVEPNQVVLESIK